MSDTRERATGIIKKVFTKKAKPFGILKLLTPTDLKGEEAVFFMKNILLPPWEKKLLHYGMVMQFYVKKIRGDHIPGYAPFRAEELKPSDPAEYSASVIRSADPRPGGNGPLVCLYIALRRVSISTDSYDALELETPLLPGDVCTVCISWREMCDAALHRKTPTGEIVAVVEQQSSPPKKKSVTHEDLSAHDKVRPSSDKSPNSNDRNTENEKVVSDGELSCEEGRRVRSGRRSRSAGTEPRRRRYRSVGDNPLYDPPAMPFPYSSQSLMYPFMPYPGHIQPNGMQFHLWMQTAEYHPRADAARRFSTMNNHVQQCHPAMNAAQYQHPAMSSTHWLPPSYETTRREPPVRKTR